MTYHLDLLYDSIFILINHLDLRTWLFILICHVGISAWRFCGRLCDCCFVVGAALGAAPAPAGGPAACCEAGWGGSTFGAIIFVCVILIYLHDLSSWSVIILISPVGLSSWSVIMPFHHDFSSWSIILILHLDMCHRISSWTKILLIYHILGLSS